MTTDALDDIITATHSAFHTRGYAELTMRDIADPEGETPAERLHSLVDTIVAPSEPRSDGVQTALLETRARGPNDEAFASQVRSLVAAYLKGVRTRHVAAGHSLERSAAVVHRHIDERVVAGDNSVVTAE